MYPAGAHDHTQKLVPVWGEDTKRRWCSTEGSTVVTAVSPHAHNPASRNMAQIESMLCSDMLAMSTAVAQDSRCSRSASLVIGQRINPL